MTYLQILRIALGLAKQIQVDNPDLPGDAKFGVLIDLAGGIVGEADVSKYADSIKAVVTLAVNAWKYASVHGFKAKAAAAA
jgi:hypothetical protein